MDVRLLQLPDYNGLFEFTSDVDWLLDERREIAEHSSQKGGYVVKRHSPVSLYNLYIMHEKKITPNRLKWR